MPKYLTAFVLILLYYKSPLFRLIFIFNSHLLKCCLLLKLQYCRKMGQHCFPKKSNMCTGLGQNPIHYTKFNLIYLWCIRRIKKHKFLLLKYLIVANFDIIYLKVFQLICFFSIIFSRFSFWAFCSCSWRILIFSELFGKLFLFILFLLFLHFPRLKLIIIQLLLIS